VTSGTLVFSTNKTDCHDITEILLKVALNTINQSNKHILSYFFSIISFFFFQDKAIGVPFCQDLSTEDNFTCCLSIDKHINCNQSCSHDIMYLPTSNLNCPGNGETPDNTNIEISPIYNSTCPPGFKEISVNESFPVCLQCNDTSAANDTTTKSYTTTGYETITTTKRHSSTAPTSNNDSKSHKMTLAAVIVSVISIIGVGTIIILYLVRRKRIRSTPVSTLEYFINVISLVYSSQILSILVKYRLPFSFFFIVNLYQESDGHF
jgi:hypothetical protein